MPIRKAVFPVAGLGTRLLPATKSQPKEMLPVGCKPVVQYVVEEMIEQGLDKFLFVTGRKKRSIEDHFDDDPELAARLGDSAIGEVDYAAEGVEFYYVRQRRPAGNADAVRQAREFVGDESFVVGFGDTIISSPRMLGVVGRMMQSHVQRGAAATIAVWEVPREETYKYGVVTPQGMKPTTTLPLPTLWKSRRWKPRRVVWQLRPVIFFRQRFSPPLTRLSLGLAASCG